MNRILCLQAAKRTVEGVTEEGVHYARLNASRTAGQILTKSFEHQVREAQHEADVAEASEYKDEIKASIKKWAFQVRPHRVLPPVARAPAGASASSLTFNGSEGSLTHVWVCNAAIRILATGAA